MHRASEAGFLDLPQELSDPTKAKVHLLPVPYERTGERARSAGTGERARSAGAGERARSAGGTREGPAAIVGASHAVELYDAELDTEPAMEWGVHTMPALAADWATPEMMMEAVASAAEAVTRSGKLLLALGGEHSITPALVRGVRRVIPDALAVVQIDAHADLRDSFRGTRHSHACAMRRVLDENPGPNVQIGIRSLSMEEARFIRDNRGRVSLWTTDLLRAENPVDVAHQLTASLKGRKIYLTIDVSGLDPSVVPATGTPEPDGLSWNQACGILKMVVSAGRVVAMDCVELAPRPGLHAAELSVAKLLYRTLSWILAK